jgi:hypothetical protein
MTIDTISHVVLKQLAKANAVHFAVLVGQPGGFALRVRYNLEEKAVVTARGKLRVFSSLDTAFGYLHKFKISRFEVNSASYEGKLTEVKEPKWMSE